jgi:hypothetical protein
MEHLRERLELGTICKVLTFLGASKVLDMASSLAEVGKEAINMYYQKGTFGYPGLIGSVLEERAAGKLARVYLI